MIQRFQNPLWWFAITVVALAALRGFSALNFGTPIDLSLYERILLGFIAACWIARDARLDRSAWPADYSFMFFPIILPVYLVCTRRWKGIAWFTLLILIYLCTLVLPDILVGQ